MYIQILPVRDVLKDDPPVSLHVDGAGDLGVVDVAGAKVALGPDPVTGVVGAGALAGPGVVLVVEGLLLLPGNVLNEVVSRLVGHVGILLKEEGILRNLVGDVVGGVLGVQDAIGQVGAGRALGRRLGVAVAVLGGVMGRGVVGGGMVGGGAVRHRRPDGDGHDKDNRSNLNQKYCVHSDTTNKTNQRQQSLASGHKTKILNKKDVPTDWV